MGMLLKLKDLVTGSQLHSQDLKNPQEQKITNPSNTAEVILTPLGEPLMKKRHYKRTTTILDINPKVRKRRKKVHVQEKDIPAEIRALEKRLSYYKNKYKRISNGKSRVNNYEKEYQADWQYYRYWTKEKDWKKNYDKLYNNMVKTSRRFITFQNRLIKVFDKMGTDEQKRDLQNMINLAGKNLCEE